MNKSAILVIVVVIIVGVIALLSGVLTGGGKGGPSPIIRDEEVAEERRFVEEGKPAIDFELADFEGNTVRLSDFQGKPVFIDFWARWCPFCTDEMPVINEVFNEFGGELVVLGIHRTATEPLSRGKDFADGLGIDYILLQDKTDEVYKAYSKGTQFMPVAAFVSPDGTVFSTKAGPKTAGEIRENARALLELVKKEPEAEEEI